MVIGNESKMAGLCSFALKMNSVSFSGNNSASYLFVANLKKIKIKITMSVIGLFKSLCQYFSSSCAIGVVEFLRYHFHNVFFDNFQSSRRNISINNVENPNSTLNRILQRRLRITPNKLVSQTFVTKILKYFCLSS